MSASYRCWAEIDLNALRENLAWLRHRVGSGVRIITVVKADAYGHGLKQIAALLMQSGTDVFGVANLSEARAIRSVGRGWPILMLGACLPDALFRPDALAIDNHVRAVIAVDGELAGAGRWNPNATKEPAVVAGRDGYNRELAGERVILEVGVVEGGRVGGRNR